MGPNNVQGDRRMNLLEDMGPPSLEKMEGNVDNLILVLRWNDVLFSVSGVPRMFDADKPFPVDVRTGYFVWLPEIAA